MINGRADAVDKASHFFYYTYSMHKLGRDIDIKDSVCVGGGVGGGFTEGLGALNTEDGKWQ